jgi:hypothetical protein
MIHECLLLFYYLFDDNKMPDEIIKIKKTRNTDFKRIKPQGPGRPRNNVSTAKERNTKNNKNRVTPVVPQKGMVAKPYKQHGKWGRPKICMPFEQAREIIHNEGLFSRNDYLRWWNLNIPARMPRNPQRSYASEWKGWGDFLNHYNAWPNPNPYYRDFFEARDYVRSLRLKNKKEWVDYVRNNELPSDIPKAPHLVYGKTFTNRLKRGGHWITWRDWLGASLSEQIISIQNKISVLCIASVPSLPNNVVTFISLNGFEPDIKHSVQTSQYTILKMYIIDPKFDWGSYLKSKYNNYYELAGAYVINNLNEVYYAFDMKMDSFRFSK